MTGIEFLEQARGAGTRREARAAHRVRRHRRRDPGDQRHRPRLLPAQAVGPARGAALPGHRRPARRLARRPPRRDERASRVVGHRWSERSHEIKTFLARNHVPYRWLDLERRRRGRIGCTSSPDADADRPAARARPRRARRCARRRLSTLADALGLRTTARAAALRPLHRRRRAGRAGRRGVRRVGRASDRRRRTRGAGRPGRARARRSRTTSGSRKGLSGSPT